MTSYQGITYEGEESRAAVTTVFGHKMSPEDIARLAGARENDRVQISGSSDQFEVEMSSADGTRSASFTVYRRDNDIVIADTYVRNTGKVQGAGRDLIHAFDDMKSLGVTRLEASAVRSGEGRNSGMVGYYVWAKLGFTGAIPPSLVDEAQARFGPGITHVEQLMRLGRLGEQWWREHGDTWEATFSFEDGSYSMRMLNAWRNRIQQKSEK
jgi:hypothetical protein